MEKVLAEKSRAVARGRLLRAFERVDVPIGIEVASGLLTVHSVPWATFWRPVWALSSPEIRKGIGILREAWSTYIRSGFRRSAAREYCCRYFILLGQVVERCWSMQPGKQEQSALQTILGFESLGIVTTGSETAVAGATTTLRNPCYLLAKLKHESALDDPQFLPLLTVPSAGPPGCFYHYRQHRLCTPLLRTHILR